MKTIFRNYSFNVKLFLISNLIFIIFSLSEIEAQNIGINGTGANAHTSALLDIDDAGTNTKGLLIPRIPLTAINVATPVTSPATSLLVYNTASASTGTNAVSPGYYYWDGVKWVRFAYTSSGSSANAWTLLGNAGTTPGINFLGTTDAQDLVFRTNNSEKMRVLSNGYTGIGLINPNEQLEVINHIGIRSANPFLYFNSTFTTIPADASIGIRSAGEIVLRSNTTNTLIPDWEVKYGLGTNLNPNDYFYVGRRAISSGTLSNYFAINSIGNIGISNTAPATQLDVAGLGQIWVRKALGGGLPATAGEGLKIESGPNGGLLQAYDYTTITPKNILMQTVGGNVGIRTTSPVGLLANTGINYGALGQGVDIPSFNWENTVVGGTGWAGVISSRGTHGLLASTDGTTSTHIPFLVTSGTYSLASNTRPNDNLFAVTGNGNVGVGTASPVFKLHVENGQIAQIFTTNTSHSIFMANPSGRNWQLYHLSPSDANAPNGFMFEHFDGSVWQRRMTINQAGNVGIGISNPSAKLHINQSALGTSGLTMVFPATSFFIQEDTDLQLYTNIRKLTGKGFIFSALPDNPDLVIKDTLLGAVGVGTKNPTTKLHVVATNPNTAFRMQDGTEGAGKVLTSDATGNATWQSPSALANYPYQSIGALPMGANCPVGGTYATSTIVLPAGIYYYTNYSCDGQIGASTPAGFNVDIQIVAGTGDSNGTFHDFNIGFGGSCGNYFTGIVRCFTPCTVRRVYTSYGGSSFTVSVPNSESTLFIKIL